jgi:hypothetical protein
LPQPYTTRVDATAYTSTPVQRSDSAPLSLGAMAGMLEPFGVPMTADINAIGFSLWALWAFCLGISLLAEGRRGPARSAHAV